MSEIDSPARNVNGEEDESDAMPAFVRAVAGRRQPAAVPEMATKAAAASEKLSRPMSTLVIEAADPATQVISLQRVVKKVRPAMEEDCYADDHKKRGLCLIFEHDTFRPDMCLSPRKGSEVDLKSATACFKSMGFDVHVERNLHYVDLMRLLSRVAVMDHSDSDCLIIVLLSHGNEGTLFAYDAAFPTQRLWEPFVAEKAPTLVGKPKMFFLQACQGNMMDVGVRVVKKQVTQTDSFASYKVPGHADFLIAHSTISGFYSWRNTLQGSWYMQSLTRVFKQRRNKHMDLVSMLTEVNKVVAEEYESNSSRPEFNDKKQTPFIYSTLTSKLYLEDKKGEDQAEEDK